MRQWREKKWEGVRERERIQESTLLFAGNLSNCGLFSVVLMFVVFFVCKHSQSG